MFKKTLIAIIVSGISFQSQANLLDRIGAVGERLSSLEGSTLVPTEEEAALYAELLFKEALILGIEQAQDFSEATNFSDLNPRSVQISAAVATGLLGLYVTRQTHRFGQTLVNAITPNERMRVFNEIAEDLKKSEIRYKSLIAKANQKVASTQSPSLRAQYRAVSLRMQLNLERVQHRAIQHSFVRPGAAYRVGRVARVLGRVTIALAGVSAAVVIVNHTVTIASIPAERVENVLFHLRADVEQIEDTLVQLESSRVADEDLDQMLEDINNQ